MKLCIISVLLLAGAVSGVIEKRVLGRKCGVERRYHVQIESVKGSKSCGGALLDTRWVITAAHCAEQEVTVKLGNNVAPSIALFTQHLIQRIPVKQQFTFKDEEGKPHDIMLMKLNKAVSPKLPTISRYSKVCTKLEVNDEVKIGGMGAKKRVRSQRQHLKCASKVISECGENDKLETIYQNGDSVKCARIPAVGFCFGDSGSAVEHFEHLQGIIISDPKDTCENSIMLLDICKYMEWIDKTMKEK